MQVKFPCSPPGCRGPRGRLGPEESGEHWEHIAFSLKHTTAGLRSSRKFRGASSGQMVQFSSALDVGLYFTLEYYL